MSNQKLILFYNQFFNDFLALTIDKLNKIDSFHSALHIDMDIFF